VGIAVASLIKNSSNADDDLAGWGSFEPTAAQSETKDDDDDWGDSDRKQVAALRAKDADRKLREDNRKKEVEEANKKALAEAAKRKEELVAKKLEDKEQKEREEEKARQAARDAARVEAQKVERTVDLDAQRDVMRQFEDLDNDSTGGASPSSDFGF
jgi:hypothetical protein